MAEESKIIPPHSISMKTYLERDLKPVLENRHFIWMAYPTLASHYDIEEYDPNMTFSVIVCNCMRGNHLPEVLFSVVNQNWPKSQYEILVMDDNSPVSPEGYSDKEHCMKLMRQLLRKYSECDIRAWEAHKNVTYNQALASNFLVKRAKYDVCIFCDADVPMLTKDYMLACAKHHTQFDKFWLSPLLWGVHPHLYKEPRGVPDFEPNYRNYYWKWNWRNPPRDVLFLMLVNQPMQWRGGSIRTKYYVDVRGYCEISRGWGGIDPNIWARWSKLGIITSQDWTLPAGHLPHPITQDPEIKRLFGARTDGGWCNDLVCNDENWGEIDTVEEIFP